MVTATVDGKGTVTRIVIDPTVVDPRDVEMLEDLVMAAVTEAQGKAHGQYEEDMRKAAGGMPIQLPGLF
jgi:DNA-binding protein YbaB